MIAQELLPVQTNATPSRLQMSYEEFLNWAGEDTHAEWVDGEVIVFMPAKNVHQTTLAFLYVLLDLFVRLFNLGKVQIAPFEMKLKTSRRSSREPDVLFVAQTHLSRLSNERLTGPADLVIEIVSDDSVQRDRRDKYKEYQEAGIPEYWIIDPRPGKQRADFFRLDEQGLYELFATEDDERVASTVLSGFWLKPAWLWHETDPFLAFAEMAGLPESFVQEFRQRAQAGLRESGTQ